MLHKAAIMLSQQLTKHAWLHNYKHYVKRFAVHLASLVGPKIGAAAGYVIASALVRLERRTVVSAVKYFAEQRPPGIYKRHYIEELFKYSHELL